jgi:hypothetical protein
MKGRDFERDTLEGWLPWSPLVLPAVAFSLLCHVINPGLGLLVSFSCLIALVDARPRRPWLAFSLAGAVLAGLVYWGLALWWQVN